VSCLQKLLQSKKISSDETVVCIATGQGLKDPHSATILFPTFPSVDKSIEEVSAFLESGILDMQSKKGNQKVLFSAPASADEIKNVAENEFSFDVEKNSELFSELCEEVGFFFERRNEMKKSEFNLILEEVISNFHFQPDNILKIIDFSGTTSFSKKATACVKVEILGEYSESCSEGTGIVDAAISAIESLIKEKTDFKICLKNYEVKVPSGGVNATVRVKMRFVDNKNNSVRVVGVSSDVVVASLLAYQKGFARLYVGK